MGILSFIEKQTIYRIFGISDGYVFKFWSDRGLYNKNTTQQLILESCNIDIYKDESYKNLSQQKCIEKIFASNNPQLITNLLSAFLEYFSFGMVDCDWSDEDRHDYFAVEEIVERLKSTQSISLPEKESADLKLILNDIKTNINLGRPELVIDRLHTFATNYIRNICQSHNISISDDRGNNYALDSLVGRLKSWYEQENYFDSEFCIVAIRNSINIFSKYNDIRNSRSAAHPNNLLSAIEAEYVVNIISDTLMFIDNIENNNNL